TEVTVAVGDEIGCAVVLSIGTEPIGVPPEVQSVAGGPHSENWTLPLQVEMPVTLTVAWSATVTEPGAVEKPPAGTGLPLASVGVVCTVVLHPPKPPRMKSFSVAVVDVDDRVSDATDWKHRSARPRVDRLTPPS